MRVLFIGIVCTRDPMCVCACVRACVRDLVCVCFCHALYENVMFRMFCMFVYHWFV